MRSGPGSTAVAKWQELASDSDMMTGIVPVKW